MTGRHRAEGVGRPEQGPGRHVDTGRQPGNLARADRTPDDLYETPGRAADDPDMGAR